MIKIHGVNYVLAYNKETDTTTIFADYDGHYVLVDFMYGADKKFAEDLIKYKHCKFILRTALHIKLRSEYNQWDCSVFEPTHISVGIDELKEIVGQTYFKEDKEWEELMEEIK